MSAKLGCVSKAITRNVDCDDSSARECEQMLNCICAESAGTDDNGGSARWDATKRSLHCVVRGCTGIGERTGNHGVEAIELHEFTSCCHKYIPGEPAINPVAPSDD